MEIKIIFLFIACFAVSFLIRMLVALLREAVRETGLRMPRQVVIRETAKVPARNLSRLRIADQNRIRLVPMS